MLEPDYRFFSNELQLSCVQNLYERNCFLVPSWLRELSFDAYEAPEDGSTRCLAETTCSVEYGSAEIHIFNSFFAASSQAQANTIRHELVHVAHFRILDMVNSRLIPDIKEFSEGLAKYMEEDFRQRVEEFTQHMADVFLEKTDV